MIYIVCFSGGHSSALSAIETVKKVGKSDVILLNHDISSKVEHPDIKRFKNDVATLLGLDITYANAEDWENKTPLKVCREIGAFKVDNGPVLCTSKLKTEPFYKWLKTNFPVKEGQVREDIKIVYGFDKSEPHRIQRRIGVMASLGYQTEYPLAHGTRTLEKTEELGIQRPLTYRIYRHANCQGCLKAGKQQWYITYCMRPDLWEEGKDTEKEIGYSILKGTYLEDLEDKFYDMKIKKNICPSEKTPPATFWAKVNNSIPEQVSMLPCECAI